MLDNLKKTGTQTPTQTVVPATEVAPSGATVETTKPVAGVIRTRSSNIIERVGWTAAQAFLGAFVVTFTGAQQLNISGLKAAALAGGSAVVAAVLALVKNVFVTKNEG
jgi:hypothetical protein